MADVEGLGWVWAPGNALGEEGAAALAGPLSKLVHLTSLDLDGTWHGGVGCVACVYACRVVSGCAWAVVAVSSCVTDVEGLGCGCAPGNGLGAEGAAALAGPLGKLVHLTSLGLRCTWHGGVACVYACRAVSGCTWEAVAV